MPNQLQTAGCCCAGGGQLQAQCVIATLSGADCDECSQCAYCLDDELEEFVNDSFKLNNGVFPPGESGIGTGFGSGECLWTGTFCAPCGVGGSGQLFITRRTDGTYFARLSIDNDRLVWDQELGTLSDFQCKEVVDGLSLTFNAGESTGYDYPGTVQCNLSESVFNVAVEINGQHCQSDECEQPDYSLFCLQAAIQGFVNNECGGCMYCQYYNEIYNLVHSGGCSWGGKMCQAGVRELRYCDQFDPEEPGYLFLSVDMYVNGDGHYVLRCSMGQITPGFPASPIAVWDKVFTTKPQCKTLNVTLNYNAEESPAEDYMDTWCDISASTVQITAMENNDCEQDIECGELIADCNSAVGTVHLRCLERKVPVQCVVSISDNFQHVPFPGGNFPCNPEFVPGAEDCHETTVVCERNNGSAGGNTTNNRCIGEWSLYPLGYDYGGTCVKGNVLVRLVRQTFPDILGGTVSVTAIRIMVGYGPGYETPFEHSVFYQCIWPECPDTKVDCFKGGSTTFSDNFSTIPANGQARHCSWDGIPFTSGKQGRCQHPDGGTPITFSFVFD